MGTSALLEAVPRPGPKWPLSLGPWACSKSYGMSSVPCLMALSYVLWPCPMSEGRVLCLMALSCALWPCPMSYGPVNYPVARLGGWPKGPSLGVGLQEPWAWDMGHTRNGN